jgi:cell division septation protein DedD
MPTLPTRERDMTDYRDQRPEYRDRDSENDEREISLGTGTILGIFFALAIVCAVFFGLGYSMGRKSAQPAAPIATATPAAAPNTFANFKPSAGSSVAPPGQVPQPKQSPEAPNDPADRPPPTDPDATIVTTPVNKSEPKAEARIEASSAKPKPAPPALRATVAPETTAPPTLAMPAINSNGTTIVQVAAVSHQEDADVLIAALKKRGYAVFIRQEPQDHLLHVQVGPFATRKDADAMRQRLLSDGYNAIVK